MKKNISTIVFAIIWLLIISTLLCIPGSDLPKINWQDKIWLDKWVHVFLFMVLIFLWNKAYSNKKNIRKIFFQIMIIGFLYGILMEIVQEYFIPNRSFDLFDILADGAGCIIGYLVSIKRFVKN